MGSKVSVHHCTKLSEDGAGLFSVVYLCNIYKIRITVDNDAGFKRMLWIKTTECELCFVSRKVENISGIPYVWGVTYTAVGYYPLTGVR